MTNLTLNKMLVAFDSVQQDMKEDIRSAIKYLADGNFLFHLSNGYESVDIGDGEYVDMVHINPTAHADYYSMVGTVGINLTCWAENNMCENSKTDLTLLVDTVKKGWVCFPVLDSVLGELLGWVTEEGVMHADSSSFSVEDEATIEVLREFLNETYRAAQLGVSNVDLLFSSVSFRGLELADPESEDDGSNDGELVGTTIEGHYVLACRSLLGYDHDQLLLQSKEEGLSTAHCVNGRLVEMTEY